MKKPILLLSLTASLLTVLPQAQAQKNTAFAITGETKGNRNWTSLREVDLSNGSLLRNIYIPLSQRPTHVDASTGQVINTTNAAINQPTQLLSAASAYDARQNRLYFINLFGNELQYIDLNQRVLKIFHVKSQRVKQFVSQLDESDNITRMVVGSDGYGYALTNNGNHLIRFSTDKNTIITDLGSLKDGSHNGDISVHMKTASWGGDMVADDGGHLYLFTIAGHVFKINPATMVADLVGIVKDLPESYSVNAAAVDEDGNVVVSSSLDADNYYRVNMSSLEASVVNQEEVFNASDFANGNLIACGDKKIEAPAVQLKEEVNKMIGVYPNPVLNKTVHVYFNNQLKGKSMIEIADLSGKKVANVEVMITAKGQYQTVQLPATITPGMYVVRVMNADKSVFSQNVMVK